MARQQLKKKTQKLDRFIMEERPLLSFIILLVSPSLSMPIRMSLHDFEDVIDIQSSFESGLFYLSLEYVRVSLFHA